MKPGPPRNRRLLAALCCVSLAAPAASCVRLPRRAAPDAGTAARTDFQSGKAGQRRIPINSATREELERLPGVGPGLAARIVAHRERHGPFRRPEHLMLVRGIGERRFRELRALVTVE